MLTIFCLNEASQLIKLKKKFYSLHNASLYGYSDIVKYLIENEANIVEKDDNNWTLCKTEQWFGTGNIFLGAIQYADPF